MIKKTATFFLFILIFYAAPVHAQEKPYILEADEVTRIDNNTFQATGNVILKVRDIVFTSDVLIYHQGTDEVEASGNVKITSQTQEIEADYITYNLKTESGTADNIKGFLAPFNYICAKKMERTGPTTFTVQDAKISTCSGKIPDWSISMYSGKLELGGYINANHATANVLDTPLVYAPKLLYPVSTERQSGFLLPGLGYSSDKGAFLNLRYFWAPDIDFDLTLGLGLYSRSGIQEQIEARYALSGNSNFYAAFERIDDATSEAPSIVRWRTTLKNQYVPIKNLYLNVNADVVSDYLYMRDFDYFSISQFNNDNKDNVFFDQGRLAYYYDYAYVSAQYRNDFEFRDTVSGYLKTQVEQMPSVSIKKVVPVLPYLVVDYGLSFDNIQYRKQIYNTPEMGDNEIWNYKRLKADAKVYFPIDLKILTLTPALSAGYTYWFDSSRPFNFQDYTNPDFGGVYRLDSRAAQRYTGSADLSVAFKQIYRNFGPVTHGMLNTVKLKYSPNLTQDAVPNFLEDDITEHEGSVSYEMVNFLNGRNWNMRLTVNQGYDTLSDSPVLPLNVKFTTAVPNILDNYFEMRYKHSGPLIGDENRFQYLTDTLGLNITKYFRLTGTYTFDSTIQNSYNTSAELRGEANFWRFKATGYYKWQAQNDYLSFANLWPIELGAGLAYYAECWSLGLEFQRNMYNINTKDGQNKQEETIIYVTFSLKGIGESRLQFLKFRNNQGMQ